MIWPLPAFQALSLTTMPFDHCASAMLALLIFLDNTQLIHILGLLSSPLLLKLYGPGILMAASFLPIRYHKILQYLPEISKWSCVCMCVCVCAEFRVYEIG